MEWQTAVCSRLLKNKTLIKRYEYLTRWYVLRKVFISPLIPVDPSCLFYGSPCCVPSLPSSYGPHRSHPPPLCPLTTWHLFRFIPISWQTACVSPTGHKAAILVNQWQINQCYLFFPCLCCHRFPHPLSLLLCCLWSPELCSIKLSSLSGINCNSIRLSAPIQTLMFMAGAFIYEILCSKRCSDFLFFLLRLNLNFLIPWTLFF